MNGLSRDARALLERARSQHEPTANDRQAVLRGLAPKLPAAAALVTATVHTLSAAASTAPVASASAALVGKWLVGGLLLGALGVGSGVLVERTAHEPKARVSAVAGGSASARPRPRRAPAGLPSADEAAPSEEIQPTETPDAAPNAESKPGTPGGDPLALGPRGGLNRAPKREASPSASVSPALARTGVAAFPEPPQAQLGENVAMRARSQSTPESTRSADLLAEARALREAQAALDAGHARQALALVEAQSKQFASGELQEERNAARLLALCALGKSDLVERDVTAFLSASSSSPLAPRVRKACKRH